MLDKTLDTLFSFVIRVCKINNIDESHALKHSMQVYQFSKQIFRDEIKRNPFLKEYEDIIYLSSILHDMIDDKYIKDTDTTSTTNNTVTTVIFDKQYSIRQMFKENNLPYKKEQIDVMFDIITKMSYSKISKTGIPDMGKYTDVFNIVRDSDLLAGYDIERAIIYGMYRTKLDYTESVKSSKEMMKSRMLYYKDSHIKTKKAKELAKELHKKLEYDIINY